MMSSKPIVTSPLVKSAMSVEPKGTSEVKSAEKKLSCAAQSLLNPEDAKHNKLLSLLFKGEQDRVLALLEKLEKEDGNLLWKLLNKRRNIKDPSGRLFKGVTLLQIALWRVDAKMLRLAIPLVKRVELYRYISDQVWEPEGVWQGGVPEYVKVNGKHIDSGNAEKVKEYEALKLEILNELYPLIEASNARIVTP
ncbi:MAG: hypothetical protein ACYCQI_16615 [Gammaproteobacteria bacterium]